MSTVPVADATTPAAREKPGWEQKLLTGSRGPALGLLVLAAALTIYSPFFLTKDNLLNVIDQVTVLGILALGMAVVIIIGGISMGARAASTRSSPSWCAGGWR
jgi:ribose transport system permease protein